MPQAHNLVYLSAILSRPTMNDNEMVDSYGVSFPPHTRVFHWQHVKSAIDKHEQEKLIPVPISQQGQWKDTPAGRYEKGIGV